MTDFINDLDENDEIWHAIRSNDISFLEREIACGAINNARVDGHAAIHYAVALNKPDVISLLISGGAEVNNRSNKGTTALLLATIMDRTDCLNILISGGADIFLVDQYGNNVLYYVVLRKDLKALVTILDAGGGKLLALENKRGLTPLSLMNVLYCKEMLVYLWKLGIGDVPYLMGTCPLIKSHECILLLLGQKRLPPELLRMTCVFFF